jgi:predicted nucleic acid-binding protein
VTGYLIDTNVVSELRKKRGCDANVRAWQDETSRHEMYISVISMMEIRHGMLAAKRRNAEFARLLEDWYEGQVKIAFDGHVLPIDLAVCERCSTLLSERSRNLADALIAATAYVGDLTLATRNVTDFADAGIKLVNPWDRSGG